jgi:L-asparaginase / beta-aspartyl-peptidase
MNRISALSLFASLALALFPLSLLSQSPQESTDENGRAEVVLRRVEEPRWALAIHGGAGTIPKDLPAERVAAYKKSLEEALKIGRGVLAGGGTSLDAVEKVVNFLEDDPLFNAGRGAVFTNAGTHELDAAIMDGRDLSAGSVAAVKTVRHPISLARLVMTKTPHVFLVGEGAEAFAGEMKVERVENSWFSTEDRREQWKKAQEREKGTVGAVALDTHGNLAAATSTGGMTNKRWGRIGDVPVIGAGTYANNRTCAISATGHGEQFIRHTVAHEISALMDYEGLPIDKAAERVLSRLEPGAGGVIGVARDGSIALVFTSEGMYRGAADSTGRLDVAIWE